jgi:hypothetical protein
LEPTHRKSVIRRRVNLQKGMINWLKACAAPPSMVCV